MESVGGNFIETLGACEDAAASANEAVSAAGNEQNEAERGQLVDQLRGLPREEKGQDINHDDSIQKTQETQKA